MLIKTLKGIIRYDIVLQSINDIWSETVLITFSSFPISELLSNTASLTTTNRPIGDSRSSMHTREPFEKAYKVYHVLGKGGFGIVYAGVRNQDGLQVAIKHIAKAKIKDWGQVSYSLFLTFYLVNIHYDIPTDIALGKYISNTLFKNFSCRKRIQI